MVGLSYRENQTIKNMSYETCLKNSLKHTAAIGFFLKKLAGP